MHTFNSLLRTSVAILICLMFTTPAIAGPGPAVFERILPLSGTQIQPNAQVTVENELFFNSTYSANIDGPYPLKNIISLKINEASNIYLSTPFTATVKLRITYTYTLTDSAYIEKDFIIKYDTGATSSYKNVDLYVFNNAHRVTVKIISINAVTKTNADITSTVSPALMVENRMQIQPYYKFDCINKIVSSLTATDSARQNPDELYVSWSNVIGAGEYDLEWAYIDDSALSRYTTNISKFENNASRVSITGTEYAIPLMYDSKGKLFFRVRAIQYGISGNRVEANWSNITGEYIFGGHERKLNWQATTTYAEEGKRKVVIQYFDGGLRARQTVTKDNTSNTTVVAESFYDYQGRPVIQVLPSPTLSNIIQYTKQFNVGLNGGEYEKNNFDTLPSAAAYCATAANGMGTQSGASRYYSASNPESNTGFHRYIPDAESYPFTETVYTQDNTGRISRQSGVGASFKLGSGHETKYFYGTPDQRELDALFGTEVGDRSHYFKNMVQDANGQFSVSYVDMHGRTIANALAGDAPQQLQALPSNASKTITETLADSNNAIIKDLAIENKKSLLVSGAGSYQFNYALNPESLLKNGCNQTQVCYDCLYDLRITISDDCNNQKLGGQAFDTTLRNFTLGSIDTTCAAAQGLSLNFTLNLEPGNYEITKQLSISRYGADYYRDSVFMKKNSCKTLQQVIAEQQTIFYQTVQCVPNCQSCRDSVGEWTTFQPRFMQRAGIAIADTADNRGLAWTAYQEALESCRILCDSMGDNEDIRRAMLLDVTPPTGQYADIQNIEDKYSIFFSPEDGSGNDLPAQYKNDLIIYKDAQGNPDYVIDEYTGQLVTPNNLDSAQFAAKFKPSWAEALLPLHPEKCKLDKYETYSSSHYWDRRFEKVETYQDAYSKGYLNPTGTNPFGFPSGPGGTDPLAATFSTAINGYLTSYQTYQTGGNTIAISLWSMATMIVKCKSNDITCINGCISNPFNTTMCTGDLDMAWRNFREMYLQIKKNIIDGSLNSSCPASPTVTTLLAAGHQPNFNTSANLLSQNGLGYVNNSTPVGQFQDSANAALGAFYQSNCAAYAQQWVQQLAPCVYTPAALSVIIPQLINVCRKGSDVGHPYGSSSISPDSSYTYKSFEEVIEAYNTANGITNIYCNAQLITAPKPFNRQPIYGNKPITSKPDDCECTTLTNWKTEYTNYATVMDTSFSAYIQRVKRVTISDAALNSLLELCNPTSTCKFLSTPVYLPPGMQCNSGEVCAQCLTIDTLYQRFKIKYPGIIPTVEEPDTFQQHKNQLFANFMNNRLGYGLQAWEYLKFMNQCGISYAPDATFDGANCDEITNFVIKDFTDYYAQLEEPKLPCKGELIKYFNSQYKTHYTYAQIRQILLENCGADINDYVLCDGLIENTNCDVLSQIKKDFDIYYGYLKPQPYCTAAFELYFNAYYGTDYNFFQIDSVYAANGCANPDACGYKGSLNGEMCSVMTSIRYNFTTYYNQLPTPKPTLQNAFENYFNENSSSIFSLAINFSFADIQYLYSHYCNTAVYYGPYTDELRLCGKSEPVFPSVSPNTITNCSDSSFFIISKATELFNAYHDSLQNSFDTAYRHKCLNAYKLETFTVTHLVKEYHYTLYYYDQAGNLVKTVPPAGVNAIYRTSWLDSVKLARAAGLSKTPDHFMITQYRYNSLNQVVSQNTPDAGKSEFWYDRLGRLVVSRNAKQPSQVRYSYTLYDGIGRITEVGELQTTSSMNNNISRKATSLQNWINGGYKNDVTTTVYDQAYTPIEPVLAAKNLRNRVAYTIRNNTFIYPAAINATYYSYDINGNVDTLLQDYRVGLMANNYNRFKKLVYEYDLISGKVNNIAYQPHQADAFYHHYSYDAENRIANVETSHDSIYWEHDAYYDYYRHGPLARTIIGQQQVQGTDYAYTLQGWLKGVNSTSLSTSYDMGFDGNTYNHTTRDIFSYSLQYYNNDFLTIGGNSPFAAMPVLPTPAGQTVTGGQALYNGNIATMMVNLPNTGTPLLNAYSYDQLNRLVAMDCYNGLNTATNAWSNITSIADYKERVSYDPNGNILSYFRNGTTNGNKPLAMDRLNYSYTWETYQDGSITRYRLKNNRLRFVKDSVDATNYSGDIDSQVALNISTNPNLNTNNNSNANDNYTYDAIGNLIKDKQAYIDDIKWDVYGKIYQINKQNTVTNVSTTIIYSYDAMGNRVGKKVQVTDQLNPGRSKTTETWYVRDAQGNVLSVYAREGYSDLKQTEVHLYGSSRLGMYKPNINVQNIAQPVYTNMPPLNDGLSSEFVRGNKRYELSNHLGNVLVTISDKKKAVSSNNTSIDYYIADVVNANDYYPFGMAMPTRTYTNDLADTISTSHGLTMTSGIPNGGANIESVANTFTVEMLVKPATDHEIDMESTTGFEGVWGQKYVIFPAYGGSAASGKAGMGISVGTNGVSVYEHADSYMPPVLVWESPDPLTEWTHVAVVYENKTPSLYIDGVLVHTGLTSTKDSVYAGTQLPGGFYGSQANGEVDEIRIWGVARTAAEIEANRNHEVSGNNSDLLAYWPMNEGSGDTLHDVSGHGHNIDLSSAGYNGGNWNSGASNLLPLVSDKYRYGFNRQEHSTEIGDDSYTAEFWEYDSRIGRRWNLDPKPTVGISGYVTFFNNPISTSDVLGDTPTTGNRIQGGKPCGTCGKQETNVQKVVRKSIEYIAKAYNVKHFLTLDDEVDDSKVNASQLFYQWVMGTGERDRNFDENSTMGKQMLKTEEVDAGINKTIENFKNGKGQITSFARSLSKENELMYAKSFIDDLDDNPARALHGSFAGEVMVVKTKETKLGVSYHLKIIIKDKLSASSGTRYPPSLGGYEKGKEKSVFSGTDPYGPTGNFRTINTYYNMNIEVFKYNRVINAALKIFEYFTK